MLAASLKWEGWGERWISTSTRDVRVWSLGMRERKASFIDF